MENEAFSPPVWVHLGEVVDDLSGTQAPSTFR